MAAAGADGMFGFGSYEGCISGSDVGKERRPYHRNCGCALHNRSENKKYRQQCAHGGQKGKSVSYPMRRAWSEGNLGLVVANGSCCSGQTSPSTSPAAAAVRQPQTVRHHRMGSVGSFDRLSAFDEEEEEDIVFFKRMSTLGLYGMMCKCVLEECLSMQNTEIERRPYHKNCNYALHKSKGGACSNSCPQQRNISFTKKQSWRGSSMRISATVPSRFSSSTPCN